ncbi:hypothetical protein HN51_068660 [Arachis hypogaea]|uniref:DUF4408 domain-containing protein n=1 Tax=Arachis hypogaea TaxID=3818 RepID=A0A444Z9G1_ARAHY|nr:uncharacterized protein LOC107641693 [Arachis ipaensis]XP_025653509.1 uncharacterized protein LOC112749473 [Arachis hypogaea]QHO10759.1 uncharacterized protein DS421_15g492380 [Arachis hypogaea]RYR10812.1 hypothetical protein Ahy_B05g079296 [Arachis hypogaea]
MEAFDFSNSKEEKGSAMSGHIFSGIAKTLRILELCIALFLLSWILTRLPLAIRLSANCLRSPLFVFALFNAIIAALLAQSARLSASDHRTSHSEPQAEHRHNQLITDRAVTDTCTDNGSCAAADSGSNFSSQRVFRRIRSEKLEEDEGRTTERKKLRRSETETETAKAVESSYPQHDKLSNEEFRQTIEAFIARQMSLLREESLAIVVKTSE